MIYTIKSKVRYILSGIKNLIRWRKIIFNDRDWDYFFIYEILKKKLEFQRDHIKQYSLHENFKRDIDTLTECIELIEIVQHEDCIAKELNNNSDWNKETFKRAEECHTSARQKLFKKLEENIEYWWD